MFRIYAYTLGPLLLDFLALFIYYLFKRWHRPIPTITSIEAFCEKGDTNEQ